jgi:hypothetical protein
VAIRIAILCRKKVKLKLTDIKPKKVKYKKGK